MEQQQLPDDARLVLSGPVTLQSIEPVYARLLDLAGQPAVTIDCGAVSETDLALVQLILAARASALRAGRTLRLAQPAAGALLETLRRGGLLGLDGAPPAPDEPFWTQPEAA